MTEYGIIIRKNFNEMVKFLEKLNNGSCDTCPAYDFCYDNETVTDCATAFTNWLNSKHPFSTPACPYNPHNFCSHYNAETNSCDLNILNNPIYNSCDF